MKFKINKEDKRRGGVYIIRNTVDSRFYVGSTKCLIRRYYNHNNTLKNNIHSSTPLQEFVNLHGLITLEFSILEFCPIDKLKEREQFYLDTLNPVENGFNFCLDSKSFLGTTRSQETIAKQLATRGEWKHKPEAKEKISKANSGRKISEERKQKIGDFFRGKPRSEETKRKISEGNKGKKSNPEHMERLRQLSLGRKRAPEAIEKQRQRQTGVPRSPETIEKLRQANLGKKLSPEHKEKMRQVALLRESKKRNKDL